MNLTGRATGRREWLLILSLILLVVVARAPSLEQPFDNDGGARAYHTRLILDGQPLYSSHHPGHHMPGIYYTYAMAFGVLGDGVLAIKVVQILYTLAATLLIFRLGITVIGRTGGYLAAVFYAVLTAHIWLWGMHAQTEHFANAPRIASVLALVYAIRDDDRPRRFFFVGLLCALAFLYKAAYLSTLALAGIALLVWFWTARQRPGAWRQAFERGLWLAGGFVIALLPAVLYFGFQGLLPRWLLAFSLGASYLDAETFYQVAGEYRALYPFFALAMNNVILLVLGAAAALLIALRAGRPPYPITLIALWFGLSVGETSISRFFFLHYYLLVVPPLVLLAAWLMIRMADSLRSKLASRGRMVAAGFLGLWIAAALAVSVSQNLHYHAAYWRYRLGAATYEEFLMNGWTMAGEELARARSIAGYVHGRTAGSDRIFNWSDDAQIYYMAGRLSPVDVIWPLYVSATGPPQRVFTPETRYIIVDPELNPPEWLFEGLAADYSLDAVISGRQIYRRQ